MSHDNEPGLYLIRFKPTSVQSLVLLTSNNRLFSLLLGAVMQIFQPGKDISLVLGELEPWWRYFVRFVHLRYFSSFDYSYMPTYCRFVVVCLFVCCCFMFV